MHDSNSRSNGFWISKTFPEVLKIQETSSKLNLTIYLTSIKRTISKAYMGDVMQRHPFSISHCPSLGSWLTASAAGRRACIYLRVGGLFLLGAARFCTLSSFACFNCADKYSFRYVNGPPELLILRTSFLAGVPRGRAEPLPIIWLRLGFPVFEWFIFRKQLSTAAFEIQAQTVCLALHAAQI